MSGAQRHRKNGGRCGTLARGWCLVEGFVLLRGPALPECLTVRLPGSSAVTWAVVFSEPDFEL